MTANLETPMTGRGTTETVILETANLETPMAWRGTTETVNLKSENFETPMAGAGNYRDCEPQDWKLRDSNGFYMLPRWP